MKQYNILTVISSVFLKKMSIVTSIFFPSYKYFIMPIVNKLNYNPSFLFKSRHFNTVYQTLFRNINNVYYERKRIQTPDNDFLDIDFSFVKSNKAVILCHGLEGSSRAQYMKGMVRALNENNFNAACMNYRGCSGEPNKKIGAYHSGKTEDLHLIIKHIEKKYKEIYLIGFSLGGNLVLKYLGDMKHKKPKNIMKAAVISVPCDLSSASDELSKTKNYIYQKRFLKRFHEKIKDKMKIMPDKINDKAFKKIKTIRDFDNCYIAPIFKYKDAEDYYQKESSRRYISKIKIPTLIINAKDDPLLTEKCFPFLEAKNSKNVYLSAPRYGGHVGFCSFKKDIYWVEERVINFLTKNFHSIV
ncbi:MAG: alpha/beta fold hydrolase [Spirochaetia bacterium]|nr:alpha/beta fold hydrolase [Spirochaetia bacterium]